MGTLIGDMLHAGLLHEDVMTVAGKGLSRYADEPLLSADETSVSWRKPPPL